MSEELKMSEFFKLPVSNGAVKAIEFSDTVEFTNDGVAPFEATVHAINNHDTLTEQVKQLRKALANVLYAESRNTGCEPSLSVFHRAVDDALELLEQTK